MMGYGPEDQNTVLELTYNYGVKEYDKGNGYAQVKFLFQVPMVPSIITRTVMCIFSTTITHLIILFFYQIAVGTDDVYRTAEAIKLFGGQITREPGPLPGINTKITACLDPDGWKSV